MAARPIAMAPHTGLVERREGLWRSKSVRREGGPQLAPLPIGDALSPPIKPRPLPVSAGKPTTDGWREGLPPQLAAGRPHLLRNQLAPGQMRAAATDVSPVLSLSSHLVVVRSVYVRSRSW